MKGIFALAIMILSITFFVIGCEPTQNPKELQRKIVSDQEHKLQKIIPFSSEKSTFQATYFLIGGFAEGSREEQTQVRFSWEINQDDVYAFSSIPLFSGKVRLKLDKKADVPTIKFDISKNCMEIKPEYIVSHCLIQATISVREEDWPQRTNLPMN